MAIGKTWEQWRQQGQEEGRQEALKRLVIIKFGAIPTELEQRIAAASVAELDRYLERVLVATSIADVFV